MLTHAVETGTLVAEHRIFAIAACFYQCFFEFGGLAVGNIEHTLAFPGHAAAEVFHSGGENHLVTGFVAQFHHHIYQRAHFLFAFLSRPHGAVDARREVNDLAGLRLLGHVVHTVGLRQSGGP